jgi:NADPH-dependent 2,4-dienoyl-CoA reductase/sulfur reductase-like enzyme
MADDTGAVVLVGGGIAACTAARTLRRIGYAGRLTLVTDEADEPYDRPPLSKHYLAGVVGARDLRLLRPGEMTDLDLRVVTGRAAVGVDPQRRLLRLADGSELAFAALVAATGAGARRLPVGGDLTGLHYLRSRRDADALAESIGRGGRLVVVGAGFVGLEVAATARTAGLDVTVVESAPAAFTRVLGPRAGQILTGLHRDRGVAFHFGATVLDVLGGRRVERVRCRVGADDMDCPADTVVVGIGAAPRTAWLAGSGVEVDDGVVCDDGGRTTVPRVYAAGDVSRWRNRLTGGHRRVEQWQAAVEQGAVVAANVAADLGVPGARSRSWSSVPYFWSDHYEHTLRFCGAPGRVSQGRRTAGGWVSCYAESEHDPLCGVLTLDAPSALARGRRLVAAGVSWHEATEWLGALWPDTGPPVARPAGER